MTISEDPHLVVAGLLRRASRGLLLHRSPARAWYPDCWDLPGGHVERGETPAAALRRELREELGVTAVIAGIPFAHLRSEDFRMEGLGTRRWDGETVNRDMSEHDALAWLNHKEMTGLQLADPRLPALFEAALR